MTVALFGGTEEVLSGADLPEPSPVQALTEHLVRYVFEFPCLRAESWVEEGPPRRVFAT